MHRGGTESRETRLPSLFPEAYWVTRRTLACLPRQNRDPEPRRGCGAPIAASSQFLCPHFSDRVSTGAQVGSIPWCPSAKDSLCSELETAHITPKLGHQELQGSIYSAGSPRDPGSSPQEDWCPPWHSHQCSHCAACSEATVAQLLRSGTILTLEEPPLTPLPPRLISVVSAVPARLLSKKGDTSWPFSGPPLALGDSPAQT